jgi:hypothetical protein
MVMSPARPGTKADCAGECQQKLSHKIINVTEAAPILLSYQQADCSLVQNCNKSWAVVDMYIGQKASIMKLAYSQAIFFQALPSVHIRY